MVSTRLKAITGPSNSDENFTQPRISSSVSSNRNGSSSISSGYNVNDDIIDGYNSYLPVNINPNSPPAQELFLLDLPIEILDKIFSYVGYKKTAQLRVVSHEMNSICASILNSTFQRLQNYLLNRFQTIKAKMPRRESARRHHPLACECDIIETCYMRLSLLQMTFGKHIERKLICFFPGGILDEVYNVLNYIRTTPKLAKPFRATDELFDLSTMAMEYFREKIEPTLPEIAYYSNLKANTKPSFLLETKKSLRESTSSLIPTPPQSNMVLRKGIRKIKQGMKKYNNQLSVLRNELRTCKRKANEQSKQISEQQNLLSEQQKQTLEYANRLDEYDKKNEEMSRKFSTLLQELNKCKTELQYWRSKSPATPACVSCGQIITIPPEEIQALVNQGVKPEDMGIEALENYKDDYEDGDDEINSESIKKKAIDEVQIIQMNIKECNNTQINQKNDKRQQTIVDVPPKSPTSSSSILSSSSTSNTTTTITTSSSSKIGNSMKRKLLNDNNIGFIDNKKIRRVQSKISNRCQSNLSNNNSNKIKK